MTALDLTVVGMGLFSPVATTPREHAFLIRSEAAMHAGRPFIDAAGTRLAVLSCPLVDPTLPLIERLSALAAGAIGEALLPLRDWARRGEFVAELCAPEPDATLTSALFDECEQRLAHGHALRFGRRSFGAAACYEALLRAVDTIAQGASAVVIVSLDSAAHADVIAERLVPVQKWVPVPPRLSEAAAAMVVTTAAHASELRARYGRVRFAATHLGSGTDLDDEPVDGCAMTALVQQAAAGRRAFGNAFGPFSVDDLRRTVWHCAVLRNRGAFALDGDQRCVEHAIGNVGAASGLCHLIYALTCQHHQLLAHAGGTVAWAVSRDGTRGLGVIEP
jgi:hypothetical protein